MGPWPEGFLSPDQDRELRDFWEQINSMTVLNREMVKLMDSEQTKKDFAADLKSILEDLRTWINQIHEMAGPARLEIAETVVESKRANGEEIPIRAVYFIGDIEAACHVLVERLKG